MKVDQRPFIAAYRDTPLVEDRIRRFLPLVRRAAWHVHGGARSVCEVDDLVQVGLLALIECARRHTEPGEDGFAAYAKLRVRGAMIDAIRRAVPGSRGSAARRRACDDAGGAVPQSQRPIQLTSLDSVYEDTSPFFADDRPDALALLCEAEDSQRLAAAIARLPARLQLVLQLYFLEELTLAEIAAVLDVSVPRVHQLKTQAVAMARDSIGDR